MYIMHFRNNMSIQRENIGHSLLQLIYSAMADMTTALDKIAEKTAEFDVKLELMELKVKELENTIMQIDEFISSWDHNERNMNRKINNLDNEIQRLKKKK